MKKRTLKKGILMVALSIIMILGFVPMTVFAYPGDGGATLTSNDPGQYDMDGRPLLVFVTPNGGDVSRTSGNNNDSTQQFTATANNGWSFKNWRTYYKGITSDEANPNHTWDSEWCFSQPGNSNAKPELNYKTIQINQEFDAKGTYYLYAIFNPVITIKVDEGIDEYSYSRFIKNDSGGYTRYHGASGEGSNQFSNAEYGCGLQFMFDIKDTHIPMHVSLNGTDTTLNDLADNMLWATKPITIEVTTRLKQQKVSFDANGGEGTMAAQNFEHSVAQTLTANSFAKVGYTFTGWNTKADGSGTAYTDKKSVTFTPANDGDSITLYAQWKECSHAMFYSTSKNRIMETCTANCGHTATATLTASDQTYSGSAITTGASITYSEGWTGDKPQPAAGDYSNNINAGTATVTTAVEGEALTTTFKINEANIRDAVVTLDPASCTYDGSEQKPAVSVIWNDMMLTENTDYVVYYVNNVNPSSVNELGTVYVDGINNFTDRKEEVFEITNAQLTQVEVKQKGTLTYNGQEQAPTVTAKAESVNDQPVTFTYRTTSGAPYSTMSGFTDAGTYTVYYKASASNHNDYYGSFSVTVDKADQAAPAVGKTDETISQKGDGKITGVDSTMEYRAEGEDTYIAITGSTVENLAPGKYYVRVKGDNNHDPSPDTEVTITTGSGNGNHSAQSANDDRSSQTGDNSNLALWFTILFISGCALIILTIRRRKS